jgi:uncharacterized protein
MHYVLTYDLCSDYLERRGQYREAHLRYAWPLADAGVLLLGGAMDAPADRAMLLFECDTPEVPEGFARADPYVVAGLVTGWEVRRWNTVVGAGAARPVR